MKLKTLARFGAASIPALAACSPKKVDTAPAATNISSAAGQPQPGQPAADMQVVLNKLASLGGKPIETLSPIEARPQPTLAGAKGPLPVVLYTGVTHEFFGMGLVAANARAAEDYAAAQIKQRFGNS